VKRSRIIWVVLLLAAVAVYFLPTPQATLQATARIHIEQNGSDVISLTGAEGYSGFDLFYVQANYFRSFPSPSTKAAAGMK
jgi:hypothetical protein